MSRNHFTQLRRYVRFDNREKRLERRETDKLAAIRDNRIFHQEVSKQLQSWSNDYGRWTITDFQRRLPWFKIYIPSEPGKYGIKIWVVVDSETKCCSKFQIYTAQNGYRRDFGRRTHVVLELTEHFSDSGRHTKVVNFFTNVLLVHSLLGRNLTFKGTFPYNKADVPQNMQPNRNRPVLSSIFGFQENLWFLLYQNKTRRWFCYLVCMRTIMLMIKNRTNHKWCWTTVSRKVALIPSTKLSGAILHNERTEDGLLHCSATTWI